MLHFLQSESESKEEEEEKRKTSIKWADWEAGKELQHVKQGMTNKCVEMYAIHI